MFSARFFTLDVTKTKIIVIITQMITREVINSQRVNAFLLKNFTIRKN
ncbi:MAG: hypothetical protein LBC61_06040 [Candidatus Peribacteria bacterium]|nr:hypothetical protein [Candidatus Peribacteria bacterium]